MDHKKHDIIVQIQHKDHEFGILFENVQQNRKF